MKSSFSDTTNCVDVTAAPDGLDKSGEPVAVIVRDSKAPTGQGHPSPDELWFTGPEWDAFLEGVRAGEFDRSRLTADG